MWAKIVGSKVQEEVQKVTQKVQTVPKRLSVEDCKDAILLLFIEDPTKASDWGMSSLVAEKDTITSSSGHIDLTLVNQFVKQHTDRQFQNLFDRTGVHSCLKKPNGQFYMEFLLS